MVVAGVALCDAAELEDEPEELHPASAMAATAPVAAVAPRKPRRVSFGCSIVPSN